MKNDKIEIIYPEKDSMRMVAGALERSLSEYRIPLKVRQKTGINSLSEIKDNWLIVLCDPDATKDDRIKERILDYSKRGEYSHILSLLVSGGSKNSFPHELIYEEKHDGSIIEHEPLAANISAESIQKSLKKLKVERLRLLAPMLGVSFDELNRRREKQLMQLAMIPGAALLVLALIFLVFAAIRMKTIASQNDSLESEYEMIETARVEAERERDEADRQYASLIATSARLALDNRDTELAMLLSMEVLPGAGEGGDAEAVLGDALDIISDSGYVPVTSEEAYMRNRYEEIPIAKEEYNDVFPEKITMRTPDGYMPRDNPYFTLSRRAISGTYRYALYYGYFYTVDETGESAGEIRFWRVCFSDSEQEDYYIYMKDGSPADWSNPIILQDETILVSDYIDYETGSVLWHYDPFLRLLSDDAFRLKRNDNIESTSFQVIKDQDYYVVSYKPLNGNGKNGDTYFYSLKTNELIKIMDGIYEIEYIENLPQFLIGRTSTGICLVDALSLECIYSIEDEFSCHGPSILVFRHPEYGDYFIFKTNNNYAVYDLCNGNRIFSLNRSDGLVYGRSGSVIYNPDVSSEGYYAVGNGTSIELYRIWDGTLYAKIENIGDNASAEMFGPYDPVTGCRSASAIWVGNGIVYEYHENTMQVPETLEERLALAKEFLNGRTLTDEERKTYGL